jgi:hypothetical protein
VLVVNTDEAANTPACLNVLRYTLNLMEDILSSYYKCTFSYNSQIKFFPRHVDVNIFFLFRYLELVLNICPRLAVTLSIL